MVEGKDYYIENGYKVFTAQYHMNRGRCCKSGCRHCPWKSKKNNLNTSNLLFLDMDGVLADFETAVLNIYPHLKGTDNNTIWDPFADKCQERLGFYRDLPPIEGAVDAYHRLKEHYDVWILSSPSWVNTHSYTEKREWCTDHLGESVFKKLILSNEKSFFSGRALIDDRTKNGAAQFKGEHIHFGTEKFPDWDAVLSYLI